MLRLCIFLTCFCFDPRFGNILSALHEYLLCNISYYNFSNKTHITMDNWLLVILIRYSSVKAEMRISYMTVKHLILFSITENRIVAMFVIVFIGISRICVIDFPPLYCFEFSTDVNIDFWRHNYSTPYNWWHYLFSLSLFRT